MAGRGAGGEAERLRFDEAGLAGESSEEADDEVESEEVEVEAEVLALLERWWESVTRVALELVDLVEISMGLLGETSPSAFFDFFSATFPVTFGTDCEVVFFPAFSPAFAALGGGESESLLEDVSSEDESVGSCFVTASFSSSASLSELEVDEELADEAGFFPFLSFWGGFCAGDRLSGSISDSSSSLLLSLVPLLLVSSVTAAGSFSTEFLFFFTLGFSSSPSSSPSSSLLLDASS